MKRLLLLALCLSSVSGSQRKDPWLVKAKSLEEGVVICGEITSIDKNGAHVQLDGKLQAIIPKAKLTKDDYLSKNKKKYFGITNIDLNTQQIEVFSVDKQFIKKSDITRSFDFMSEPVHCAHVTNMSGQTVVCQLYYQARVYHQNQWKYTDVRSKTMTLEPNQYCELLLGKYDKPGYMPYLVKLMDKNTGLAVTANITRDEYSSDTIYVSLIP